MRLLDNINYDFLGKRKTGFIISATLITLGLISLFVRGLELGIDFKGGTEIAVNFENPVEISDIRGMIDNIGLGNVEVKTFGGDKGILIRTELQQIPTDIYPRIIQSIEKVFSGKYPELQNSIIDSAYNSVTYRISDASKLETIIETLLANGFQATAASQEEGNQDIMIRIGISDWIKENLIEKATDNPFKVLKEDRVGPKIGDELKRNTILAIVLALLVIMIYLGFRFKFAFAIGAVVALFHDVIITVGLFALLHGLIPGLNLEISISVIAALLTLVGYSINDTVIVFDRVREYIKIHKTAPLIENMNKAINKTMSRTIMTSFTTLIVLLILLVLGGEVLRGFAFALSFGIIIGTYSSIFVACPFVLEYATKTKKRIEF